MCEVKELTLDISTIYIFLIWIYFCNHKKSFCNNAVLYSLNTSNFSTWFEFQTFAVLSRWPPFGGDHVLRESPQIGSNVPPGQVPISINHLSIWGPGHFIYSYGSPPKHLGPGQSNTYHSQKSIVLVSLCESQAFSS